MSGRKQTMLELNELEPEKGPVLWIHTASLGEYEQGLPIMQQLKASYPQHTLLVTFFSPSGYEVKKRNHDADILLYLPLDTPGRVRFFLDRVSPVLAIFVKYEVWPNYYRELHRRKVPLLLVSALFKSNQAYFRWYGGLLRRSLRLTSHIFVQDEASLRLLATLGIQNCSVSGDTRFDRVTEILKRDNTLDFMEVFKGSRLCLVCGSTWPEDESFIIPYINNSPHRINYVLAPHDIKSEHVRKLQGAIRKKVVRYSELTGRMPADAEVLILDTIGLLTRVYSYADMAYVGGGFATGLHNTLEPAVFGIPVIIGPRYQGFREARELVDRKGLLVVSGTKDFKRIADKLVTEDGFRKETGRINASFVAEQQGASVQIMQYLRKLL